MFAHRPHYQLGGSQHSWKNNYINYYLDYIWKCRCEISTELSFSAPFLHRQEMFVHELFLHVNRKTLSKLSIFKVRNVSVADPDINNSILNLRKVSVADPDINNSIL